MSQLIHEFNTRQHMLKHDFEFFHYKNKSNMEVEYHNHDFFEVFCLIKGKVRYVTEGTSYGLSAGDIIIISNNDLHKPVLEQSDDDYERIVLWINPEYLKKKSNDDINLSECFVLSSKGHNNYIMPGVIDRDEIWQVINKIENVYNKKEYGNDILKEAYLLELLVLLNKGHRKTYSSDISLDISYDENIHSIINYINSNLNKDLTLDNLAKKFYLSKYYLIRKFKKYTGYTIYKYIQIKRLIYSKKLLKEGYNVTEVCQKCGFGDYSNFIRAFKSLFGTSPKKYSQRNMK
jgi:AraC-like DNA-binding protein